MGGPLPRGGRLVVCGPLVVSGSWLYDAPRMVAASWLYARLPTARRHDVGADSTHPTMAGSRKLLVASL